MGAMNFSESRAQINPVLTSIAQGFSQNTLIGSVLFPRVDVPSRAGKILSFGKEHFLTYDGLARSPGAVTKRVQYTYGNQSYGLVDYSLEGSLPKEIQQEAMMPEKGFTVDMAAISLSRAMDGLNLRLEMEQAKLATTLANYPASNRVTLSGTSQWSNAGSFPIQAVEAAKEVVRQAIGKKPNVGVMGAQVIAQLRNHASIVGRIQYTHGESITDAMIANLMGLDRIVVGESIVSDDAGNLSDVWGKHMILAHTNTASAISYGTPTFGYTYNMRGYPFAEEAYYDKPHKTWVFPVSAAEQAVIVAPQAGYFFQNAVA
jgi:hypothetical protein